MSTFSTIYVDLAEKNQDIQRPGRIHCLATSRSSVFDHWLPVVQFQLVRRDLQTCTMQAVLNIIMIGHPDDKDSSEFWGCICSRRVGVANEAGYHGPA